MNPTAALPSCGGVDEVRGVPAAERPLGFLAPRRRAWRAVLGRLEAMARAAVPSPEGVEHARLRAREMLAMARLRTSDAWDRECARFPLLVRHARWRPFAAWGVAWVAVLASVFLWPPPAQGHVSFLEAVRMACAMFGLFVVGFAWSRGGGVLHDFEDAAEGEFHRAFGGRDDFRDFSLDFLRLARERTVAPALLAVARLADPSRLGEASDRALLRAALRVGPEAAEDAMTTMVEAMEAMRSGAVRVSVTPSAEEALFALVEASPRPLGAHEVVLGPGGRREAVPLRDAGA